MLDSSVLAGPLPILRIPGRFGCARPGAPGPYSLAALD
jgi:hypothetical protein